MNPAPTTPATAPRSRAGQALIEFIVGIVAILALAAGLLQLVSLADAQLETLTEARRSAAQRAFMGQHVLDNARYIGDWDNGDDDRSYSRDDIAHLADPAAFRSTYVAALWGDPQARSTLARVPNNPLLDLDDAPDPADAFGLVSGTSQRSVPLLPAVRHLIYDDDQIDIEHTVWMTSTHGIY